MCWIQRKSEELARRSLEQVEAASNAGNRAISKENALVPEHQLSVASDTSIFHVDVFDHSVAILNIVCPLDSHGVLFS